MASSASSAARMPSPVGIPAGSVPSSSTTPLRDTIVAVGFRPTNENRAHRSAPSTDSSRNPGPSPTSFT